MSCPNGYDETNDGTFVHDSRLFPRFEWWISSWIGANLLLTDETKDILLVINSFIFTFGKTLQLTITSTLLPKYEKIKKRRNSGK